MLKVIRYRTGSGKWQIDGYIGDLTATTRAFLCWSLPTQSRTRWRASLVTTMHSVFLSPESLMSRNQEGRRDNIPLLNLSGHRVKHLVNVHRIFCRCFQEGNVEGISQFLFSTIRGLSGPGKESGGRSTHLGNAVFHNFLGHKVGFVTNQEFLDRVRCVAFNFFQPHPHVFERFYQSAVRVAINT